MGDYQLRGLDSNQTLAADRYIDVALQGSAVDGAIEIANSVALDSCPTIKQAAQGIAELRKGITYCYLAFFGLNGRCKYVKVGMSTHPERRVYKLTTGCPLDLIAIYACPETSKKAAYRLEQSLLRNMNGISRRGEWLEIDECAAKDIADVAHGLAGASCMEDGSRPEFGPVWTKWRGIA